MAISIYLMIAARQASVQTKIITIVNAVRASVILEVDEVK